MPKNSIKTHPAAAKKASNLLKNAKSKDVKSIAGSDLVNTQKNTKSKKK